MTDSAALLALATRCEQATGPDRRLDADIFAALNPEWARHQREGDLFWRGSPYAPKTMSAPHYTSSLDAALTLVIPGWSILIAIAKRASRANVHSQPIGVHGKWPEGAEAKTPALALCAAALRARAAEAGDE